MKAVMEYVLLVLIMVALIEGAQHGNWVLVGALVAGLLVAFRDELRDQR